MKKVGAYPVEFRILNVWKFDSESDILITDLGLVTIESLIVNSSKFSVDARTSIS